jgi:hypothetical protein
VAYDGNAHGATDEDDEELGASPISSGGRQLEDLAGSTRL